MPPTGMSITAPDRTEKRRGDLGPLCGIPEPVRMSTPARSPTVPMHLTIRSSLLMIALLGVLACSEAIGADAAPAAERGAAQRVVISPKPGQVVRSHQPRIRVRSRALSGVLNARLNGVQIGDYFALPRHGVRTLPASVSYGLRRGKNVLAVRVRRRGKAPRHATVRFFVRGKGPLIGAGRDRRVVVGSDVGLYGQAKGVGAAPSKLRWKVVTAPAPLEPAQGSPSPAEITSPDGPTAGFRPTALGSYVVRLTHGSGRSATSDRVRLDAVPPNPLVPIETMRLDGSMIGAIKVGDHVYPAGAVLHVLVLDRRTLAPISNTGYNSHEDERLHADIAKLDDSELVIVSVAGNLAQSNPRARLPIDELLNRIGVPGQLCGSTDNCVPLPGQYSAIGIPGMKVGDGDWNNRTNVEHPTAGLNGGLQGYLSPDQYLNYGFVPAEREPFTYGGKEVAPCASGTICEPTHLGYRLEVRDAHTLEPEAGGFQIFDTDGYGMTAAQQTAETDRMTAALKAVPAGDLITIQVVSNRERGESRYPAPVGPIDKASMVKLADAVADAGGTRNAFNRTALQTGAPASGGATYTLVGWAGAGEGAGAEAAAGLDGAGDAPLLSGVLRPGRDSEFRPAEITYSTANPQTLQNLLVAKPTGAWPLDDDPGAMRAISYLGSTDQRLGPDPRSAYWTQSFGESTTNSIIAGLKSVPYPSDASFTQDQFEAARAELIKELGWVGNVRTYLKNLSTPFADNALPSWVAAQKIADRVYDDADRPGDEVAFRWVEFTRIILGLFGPATHEVTAVVGHLLDLGSWMYGADANGAPTDREVRTKADDLGAELVEQAQQAQATYDRMGDVIVSDYAKLSVVGPNGGCNASSPSCPPELAFSTADRIAASSNVYRSVERLAYTKLLPLGYHVLSLLPYEGKAPPYPPNYKCQAFHPWIDDYTDKAPYASTSLLRELDPAGQDNVWDPFVLSKPPSDWSTHGTPPSNELLDRMFGPVSLSGDPKVGGLGISPASLVQESEHYYWYGKRSEEERLCRW